jgi:mono/diheme cytochrome c family protein
MSSPDRRASPALRGAAWWMLIGGAMLLAIGCTQQMARQPSYRPYQPSDLFADGTSARPIPADTVARGRLQDDRLLFSGLADDGTAATEFPFPVTRQVMERGRQRFEISCAPCHGYAGNGDGMVVQRGFSAPPSLHSDRLRQAPVGHLFEVISNGFGAMPPYAPTVVATDRWAIVAYIRALQLSQAAPLEVVPESARAALEAER